MFAAFSTSIENRLILRKEIANLWAVPATAADSLFPPNKPMIQVSFGFIFHAEFGYFAPKVISHSGWKYAAGLVVRLENWSSFFTACSSQCP